MASDVHTQGTGMAGTPLPITGNNIQDEPDNILQVVLYGFCSIPNNMFSIPRTGIVAACTISSIIW